VLVHVYSVCCIASLPLHPDNGQQSVGAQRHKVWHLKQDKHYFLVEALLSRLVVVVAVSVPVLIVAYPDTLQVESTCN
jgi:hypothetical protein